MLPKVLVVDDIADNVKLLALELEDAGYEVLTASNGIKALRIILEHGPTIVLTDWMMPKMDGLELCRRIRRQEGIGIVYVILVTAHSNMERLIEAFDAGADDFLPKPIDEKEIMARLKAGVRIVRLEENLAAQQLAVHKANAELAVLNSELRTLATTDELTGLGNRREAMRSLQEQWELSHRHDRPLACILFDIDHFKSVNDTFGHDAGDAMLRAVAKTVTQAGRTGERIYRIGGEEFLVVCPSATVAEAGRGAERLRIQVAEQTIEHNGRELSVTISLGAAERTADMESPDEMLRSADEALYRSKREGRNRVTMSGEARTAPAGA